MVSVRFAGVVLVLALSPLPSAGPAASSPAIPPLVDSHWLARHRAAVTVLEVRRELEEILTRHDPRGHVPGAVPVPAQALRLPRTEQGEVGFALPSDRFAALVRRLGVDAGKPVVVSWTGTRFHDLQAATYLVWSFALYGHEDAALLDRGTAGWRSAKRPVETLWPEPRPGDFTVTAVRRRLLATTAEVERIVQQGGAVLVDARDPAVFRGERPGAGTGVRGHLPKAVNLPVAELLTVDGDGDLHFRPVEELRARAVAVGLRPDRRIVVYCSGGREAAVVWFVLARLLRFPDVALYDGSLFAWTADPRRRRLLVVDGGGPPEPEGNVVPAAGQGAPRLQQERRTP